MKKMWLVCFTTFVIDTLTKQFAWRQFTPHGMSYPFKENSDFNFVIVKNEGLMLGFLSENQAFVVFVMAFAVYSLYNFLTEEDFLNKKTYLILPAGLILGGALGNLVDRMTRGFVIDFISIGDWPVFNIADAAVVTGIILMIIPENLRKNRG